MNTSIFLVKHSILWVGAFLSSGFIKNTPFFSSMAGPGTRHCPQSEKGRMKWGLAWRPAKPLRSGCWRIGWVTVMLKRGGSLEGRSFLLLPSKKSQDCHSANCNFTWFFFFFLPHCAACEILVPRPEIELTPLAVKLPSPNRWTTREFPIWFFFFF